LIIFFAFRKIGKIHQKVMESIEAVDHFDTNKRRNFNAAKE
jgi:hypothetical protein